LNIGFANVNEIIVDLGYRKVCVDGCCLRLCPEWRDQAWKHVNHYLLAIKVRVMICCTALFQVMRD